MSLIGARWADEGWDAPPQDYVTNPWGWPTRFGIGSVSHPIDPDYPMIYSIYPPLSRVVWDERLQLEYSI